MKHTDPVGLASHDELVEAYRHALETDPVASFGGIVGVNRELDGATAREIAANSYEAVVAPGFSQAALGILRGKSGLELLAVPRRPDRRDARLRHREPRLQADRRRAARRDARRRSALDRGRLQVVTQRRPTLEELTDLLFALARGPPRPLERDRARAERRHRRHRRGAGIAPGVRRDRAPARRRPGQALGHGLGRVLPVPGRHPGWRPAPASPRSSSRAARSATRWPSRSRTAIISRWSSPDDAISATDRTGSGPAGRGAPVEQLLALEMVRVTEAAAIASARVHGPRRTRWGRPAATEAMRRTMDEIDFAGRIVIGEGERDEAPMLYIGEQVGRRGTAPTCRRSTSRSIRSRAPTSSPTARPGRSPCWPRRRPAACSTRPDTYLEKLCVGPVVAGKVDIRESPDREPRADRGGARPAGPRHHGGHPRAAAPRRPHRRGPRRRRAHQAHQRRRPVGRHLLRGVGHRRPRRHGHRRRAGRRDHRGRAALPRRRDPGALPLPQRRRARARRADGPRRRGPGLPDRGPRARREPRVRGDRRHRPATCSRGSASSVAARGRTRW